MSADLSNITRIAAWTCYFILGLIIRELFLIQKFLEEVSVFQESREIPMKTFDFIKYLYIYIILYCKMKYYI